MLITLVTDNMGVVDTDEVLSADNGYLQDTHRALNIVTMGAFCLFELFLSIFQPGVVGQDVLLDFCFTLDELILSRYVLLRELGEVNATIGIFVELVKELVYDLRAVLIINTLISKEIIHFISVYSSITIRIELRKFLSEALLFSHSA